MKSFLLFRDHNFDLNQTLLSNEHDLTQDLELNTLFTVMALGDHFLFDVIKRVMLSSRQLDLDSIRYRQDILKDCLKNKKILFEIYGISMEAIETLKSTFWGIGTTYPRAILSSSVDLLQMLVTILEKLKNIADAHADRFESEGFTAFFSMLKIEIDNEFFSLVQDHLAELKFPYGVLMSLRLKMDGRGTDYVLYKQNVRKRNKLMAIVSGIFNKDATYTYHIADRDEPGARALSELRDRGINRVANALAQSVDNILGFFSLLRMELAFYIGCLNLHERLTQLGAATCFPVPAASRERRHSCTGLYDVCLSLILGQAIVDNDLNADKKQFFIITGSNQGGKTTFLRSIGVAQLMMQCGMFVPAKSFCANLCSRIFTHYKREEDDTMTSGKLDEELGRTSGIVDSIDTDSMILFNESFAATNSREGSEIARQIVSALLACNIKIFFVTHLFEFAHNFYEKPDPGHIFLRAERHEDGSRTFKLHEGEPLQTSYGNDLYKQIFAEESRE